MLPVFLAVFFGIIEGGRFVVSKLMLNYAVAVGARAAAVENTSSTTDVQTAVSRAAPMLTLGTVTVTVSGGKAFAARAPGDLVTVRASYNFRKYLWSPFPSRTFNASSEVTVQ